MLDMKRSKKRDERLMKQLMAVRKKLQKAIAAIDELEDFLIGLVNEEMDEPKHVIKLRREKLWYRIDNLRDAKMRLWNELSGYGNGW